MMSSKSKRLGRVRISSTPPSAFTARSAEIVPFKASCGWIIRCIRRERTRSRRKVRFSSFARMPAAKSPKRMSAQAKGHAPGLLPEAMASAAANSKGSWGRTAWVSKVLASLDALVAFSMAKVRLSAKPKCRKAEAVAPRDSSKCAWVRATRARRPRSSNCSAVRPAS